MPSDGSRLSDLDRRILEFEQDWVTHAGAKDSAVRERFDLTPAGYHQELNRLIDLAGAELHAPRLVRRLRRRRAARQTQRQQQREEGRQQEGEQPDERSNVG